MIRLSSMIFSLLLLASPLFAQNSGRSVVLVTMGPGTAVEEQYGHVMILLQGDPGYRRDVVYHWGLYDPSEEGFVWRFIQGRMNYSMVVWPADATLEEYQNDNRLVIYQQLPLTESQIDDLIMRCETNRKPFNAKYRYDYFKDNCATRVRDMLDQVTGGQIAKTINAQTPTTTMTYRKHSIRLAQTDFLISLGLDFVLGPSCDKPLTAWEECFLPMKMSQYIAPLSTKTWSPWESTRKPEASSSPDRRLLMFAISIAICAIGLLASRSTRRPINYLPAAISIIWWLISGFGGLLLLYMWVFTDHEAAHRNQNLLAFTPWNWLIILCMIRAGRGRMIVYARYLVTATAILSISALILHGWVLKQDNLQFLLLATPINLLMLGFVINWQRRLTARPSQVEVVSK